MVTTMEGRPRSGDENAVDHAATEPDADADGDEPGRADARLRCSPMAVEASAMIAATERSISPAMISSAMAKATMAFSVKLKVRRRDSRH